ncbi:MAG: hypothetical protein PHY45_10270 [Rhodocyclaceae bacterium]|nr:hypothetical protein [Rhodocyclaceae bacterium]
MSGTFTARLNGRFHGVLAWSQLDALWAKLREAPDGWYVSMSGHAPEREPAPVAAAELDRFVSEIDAVLRREHDEDYCGIVYVDDPQRPEFIKIYDPGNLGSSCGTQPGRVQPRWVLSRIPPDAMGDAAPLPGNRLRWWQNLFGN